MKRRIRPNFAHKITPNKYLSNVTPLAIAYFPGRLETRVMMPYTAAKKAVFVRNCRVMFKTTNMLALFAMGRYVRGLRWQPKARFWGLRRNGCNRIGTSFAAYTLVGTGPFRFD